jgi:hypothetical protein
VLRPDAMYYPCLFNFQGSVESLDVFELPKKKKPRVISITDGNDGNSSMADDNSAATILIDDCSTASVPKSVKCSKGSHKKQSLPDPFPLPQNYRYDVEFALKSWRDDS